MVSAMGTSAHNWSPLSVDAVAGVFAPVSAPWWIAGGWALDLFLGTTTREHEDIDVLVLRRDQLVVQAHLCADWELFKTKQPTPSRLAPWPRGEFLHRPIDDIWVRRPGASAWSFQIMLTDAEGDEWVYKRLPTIGGPIAEMGLMTSEGIPYLAPEIQLLHSARSALQKNRDDFERVLPTLSAKQANWLLKCLQAEYSEGHAYIGRIEADLRTRPSCGRR